MSSYSVSFFARWTVPAARALRRVDRPELRQPELT
jgi:hypothetical protein